MYSRESVVAEKLEAIIVLGARNSRIKDFFDLHYLAGRFEFDRPTLAEAVRRTFARRGTPPPAEAPIGLTPTYWENPSRAVQMRAFARRAHLKLADGSGRELAPMLEAFLLPLLDDMRAGRKRAGRWPPGGPWQLNDIST
jgi:Nucleotidyl transferase AbiEii toxin, Type IV TA system